MTHAKPLTRGDQTRELLIHAALDVFGHSGFDAASTRAIARAAGVNQALIGYHFGGKRGLYLAVFEHIIGQMQLRMMPVAEQVLGELEAAPGTLQERRELAVRLMLTVFDSYTDMIGNGVAAGWVRLILREQQDPTEAFQLLYDNIFSRLLPLIAQLVALASGFEQPTEACRIRSLMILGQVMIFFVARATASRYLDWDTYSPATVAAIKQQFHSALESQFFQGVAA